MKQPRADPGVLWVEETQDSVTTASGYYLRPRAKTPRAGTTPCKITQHAAAPPSVKHAASVATKLLFEDEPSSATPQLQPAAEGAATPAPASVQPAGEVQLTPAAAWLAQRLQSESQVQQTATQSNLQPMEDVFSTPPEAASAAVTPGTTPRAVDWVQQQEDPQEAVTEPRQPQRQLIIHEYDGARVRELEGQLAALQREREQEAAKKAQELAKLQQALQSLQIREAELSELVASKQREQQEARQQAEQTIAQLEQALLDKQKGEEEEAALAAQLEERLAEITARDQQIQELLAREDQLRQRTEELASETQAAKSVLLTAVKPEAMAHAGVAVAEESGADSLVEVASEVAALHESLQGRYLEEAAQRRRLHNQLVDLKGAIRVFCRVRPLLPDEVAASQKVATECDTLAGAVELVGGRVGGMAKGGGLSGKEKRLRFNFDAVYGGNSRQDAIFEDTAPVVTSVLDGYNVCIFAYGQTGSGKTYTIEGPEGDRGVNYRTLTALFEQVEHRRAEVEYTITVSLLEVYMDTICDLLVVDESAPRPKLEVKNGAYGSYMPGLTEAKVESAAAAWALLRSGTEARHSAQTKMNEHSSRSHCMLCVRVRGQSKLTGDVWRAKLWLVDLAGSERVGKTEASGERLKEAQFINKSLSALGDCIHALATKSAHVPFRNSKLTYVLQDSLSGDSKTLMFVNANPTEENAAETACSLHFAARVRGVELGPAKRHVEAGAEIRELRAEMAALRHEVSSIEEERRRLADKLAAREATAEALSDRLRSQQALLADKEAQLLQEKQNAVRLLSSPGAFAASPSALTATHRMQPAGRTVTKTAAKHDARQPRHATAACPARHAPPLRPEAATSPPLRTSVLRPKTPKLAMASSSSSVSASTASRSSLHASSSWGSIAGLGSSFGPATQMAANPHGTIMNSGRSSSSGVPSVVPGRPGQALPKSQGPVVQSSSMLGQPAALAQSPAAAAAKAEGLRPPRPVGVAAKDAAASGPPNAVRRMLAATASTPLRTGLGTPLTMRTSSDASIMNTARRIAGPLGSRLPSSLAALASHDAPAAPKSAAAPVPASAHMADARAAPAGAASPSRSACSADSKDNQENVPTGHGHAGTKAVMQIEQKTLSQSLDTASQGSMSARSLASNSESTRSLADSKAEYLAKFEQFRRSRAEESGRLAPGLASACKTPAPGRASFSLGASRVKTAVKATPLSRRPERTPLRSSNGRQWA